MTWKQSAQRNHNVCMMSAFNMRRSVSAAEINVNKNALLIIDVKNDNKQKIICVCVCVCHVCQSNVCWQVPRNTFSTLSFLSIIK